MLVEPLTRPRARERTVSTALCRASIEVRNATLGAHCLGGLHRVCVGVVAEDVLGGGWGARVERHEDVAVLLHRGALEIVHPICSVPFREEEPRADLCEIHGIKDVKRHIHVLFRNRGREMRMDSKGTKT